jgi:hypothetical protein
MTGKVHGKSGQAIVFKLDYILDQALRYKGNSFYSLKGKVMIRKSWHRAQEDYFQFSCAV